MKSKKPMFTISTLVAIFLIASSILYPFGGVSKAKATANYGNATAADILSGKTATVDSGQITGTWTGPEHGSQSWTTPGLYSFTVPEWVGFLAYQIGAGGGGGGRASQFVGGTGGGGGGCNVGTMYVTQGEVITLVVGAGGTGGTKSMAAAGSGGDSSFGPYIAFGGIGAKGGAGGGTGASGQNGNYTDVNTGGAGGAGGNYIGGTGGTGGRAWSDYGQDAANGLPGRNGCVNLKW